MERNSSRFMKTKLLERAPAWFVSELISEGREDLEGVGLPNDHRSFSAGQRRRNAIEQSRLDNETAVERVRRIARSKETRSR